MKKYYLALFFLSLLAVGCKKCKEEIVVEIDPCPQDGYELIDGTCQCPEDLYPAYGACRELRENEYYGITEDCPCQDTLFLRFGAVNDEGEAKVFLNEDIFDYSDVSISTMLERVRFSGYMIVDYTSLEEGDSFSSSGFNHFSPICDVGGNAAADNPYANGKFTANMDSLFVKLIYRDGTSLPNILDSCEVVFTRK